MHIHPLHIHMITTPCPPTNHPSPGSRFQDRSSPRTLTPRRVHRPSSTRTAPHQHHRWQVLPPLRTSPISSWQPYLFPRSEPATHFESAPRHCCTNTVVCRARRTRGSVQSKMALCHSAREVTHLSACSGTVGRWVCTVPLGVQLRAAGWRAARGGTALVQAAFYPPTRGEAHSTHRGQCGTSTSTGGRWRADARRAASLRTRCY
jgi:hypothetical protein